MLTQEGSWRDFDEYDKRCVELSQQDYNYEIDPRFVRNVLNMAVIIRRKR